MAQKLVPSGHLLEMFMPYRDDEKRMLEVLKKAASRGFYKENCGSFPHLKTSTVRCMFGTRWRRTV